MRGRALGLLGAAALLACGPAPMPGQGDTPRLVVEPARFDFGDARPGSELTRRFRMKNAGDAPLRILGISASCDCVVSRPDTDVIAPGEATDLRVTLHTGSDVGPVERTVTLTTNDPHRPEQTISLLARTVPAS